MLRKTFANIDLDALAFNYQHFKNKTQKSVFAVIKADAYGHGDVPVAKRLAQAGCEVFCVSSMDEARHLYQNNITQDILIFGYVCPDHVAHYHQSNFVYTIPSLEWVKTMNDLHLDVRTHLEINTGMNRFGVKSIDEAKQILDLFQGTIEGVYTHFSSAEESTTITNQQLDAFESYLTALDHPFKWIHASNTHGAAIANREILNAVRVGIGLYGYSEYDPNIKPVLSLYSQITHIDKLEKGEKVGYNGVFEADQAMHFGTLAIGYADGFDTRNAGLDVYIQGKPYPILGKICMDQTMIRVDETIKLGDVVELIGPHRTLKNVSNYIGVIPYIVLAGLRHRIERHYIQKENIFD